jgi:N-dimethylarginine dimethylaminohydrolase
MHRVLMCPPTYFEVREVKNPHMGSAIDHELARHQWEALWQAFQDAGLTVATINPVPDLDDMVFAANQVFVGTHPQSGKFIVPSRMRYPSRQKEVPYYVEWFRQRGYRVMDLDLGDECLEGHGDLIWHPGLCRIWAGYGFRSTRGGVEGFADAMAELAFPVTFLELTDPYCYHLDTCFCPLNADTVLVYSGAFSADSVARIREGFKRVHELAREDALQFMLNGVVANGKFITSRTTLRLDEILQQEGLAPVVVATSEFEKSGGSVFCMKTFLE